MPLTTPTWITAIATVVLAVGAGLTVYFARRAFNAQSQQLAGQQEVSRKQTLVLDLQARELKASLAQRQEAAESQRRAQANKVAAWLGAQEVPFSGGTRPAWGAVIRNDSELPILDVRVFFHFIAVDSTVPAQ